MTNSTKRLLYVAVVLILIGVIGSILTSQETVRAYEEEVVNSELLKEIIIKTHNERVDILPTDDSVLRVELSGVTAMDLSDKMQVNVEGQRLSIQTLPRRILFIDFFVDPLTLTVYLPHKFYESVQVDMSNGNFYAGKLKIHDLHVKTDNGNVRIDETEAANIRVDSNNGNLYFDGVLGNIRASNDNGSISVTSEGLEHPMDLSTNNGNIEIKTLREPSNVTFDLRTSNGNVTVFGSRDWHNIVGTGELPIKLRTHNGDIKITK